VSKVIGAVLVSAVCMFKVPAYHKLIVEEPSAIVPKIS
jgi:hypothetical protein